MSDINDDLKFSRTHKFLIVLTIIFLATYLYFSLLEKNNLSRFEQHTRLMMGTVVTIKVWAEPKIAGPAIEAGFARFKEIEKKFNTINLNNKIHEVLNGPEKKGDPEIIALLKKGLLVSQKSDGAFDPTVFPLIKLWGFDKGAHYLPKENEIKEVLHKVGYRSLLKDKKGDLKRPISRSLDMSGIAKGYGLYEAMRALKEKGIKNALIDAGGDIYSVGQKNNQDWRVGIQDPDKNGPQIWFNSREEAVATSGDYQRYFIKGGIRYHHLLNPGTGQPAMGVRSVTAVHPDPVLADAWSTAIFVLGPDKGFKLAQKIPGLEVFIITSSGQTLVTDGLKARLKYLEDSKQ